MTDRGCPAPERFADFYLGTLSEPEADALREHLATCEACLSVARDARRFAEAMRGGAPATRRGARRTLYAAAAALGGIALIALAVQMTGSGAPDHRPIWTVTPATFTPSDDLVWRDAASLDAAASRYREGNYVGAVADLGSYVAAHPDDSRGRFYLGVARLLAGDARGAIADLEIVAGTSGTPEDAPFYLALARLEAKDIARARADFEALAAAEGPHQGDAREILRRLQERGPP